MKQKAEEEGGQITACIILLTAALLLSWAWEARRAGRDRSLLAHVVHVNGTRGKSATARLIDAGLRAGGLRVFTKTTGTEPMTVDAEGNDKALRRRGGANIREQLAVMHRAARQGAQVLVAECMALRPELQHTAQHEMLRADIGVITNVRLDHADVMGETEEEVCSCLCSTVPENGVLFTCEERTLPQIAACCRRLNSRLVPVRPNGSEPDFEFAENIALALAVCEYLGVGRGTALLGMREYRRDPYALSAYRLGSSVFVNGFAINDRDSTRMVYEKMLVRCGTEGQRRVMLINNRMDRGSRTRDMADAALGAAPDEVWLLGAGKAYFRRRLLRGGYGGKIRCASGAGDVAALIKEGDAFVFAAGNIACGGKEIMSWVRKEGECIV